MTDTQQTQPQFDIVIPKSPAKMVIYFLKWSNLNDVVAQLNDVWPEFQKLGKVAAKKGEKKKKAAASSDSKSKGDDSAPPPPPKRNRRIKGTYKKALEMITNLQVDDTIKIQLRQQVEELYREVKEV
jgi:hypothetical protein